MLGHHSWSKALQKHLNDADPQDIETQMKALCDFKMISLHRLESFKMLEQGSSTLHFCLSEIAEAILTKTYELCLIWMKKHYLIRASIDDIQRVIAFGIVAYGKLGAKELNTNSDLDLVFLYAAQNDAYVIEGKVTVAEFSLRLAQRIIQVLSTQTLSGALYQIDVRLRPRGRVGPLVSHFSIFQDYLYQEAWTWEHQALVKTRMVVGSLSLQHAFEKLRANILSLPRHRYDLRREIKVMREKMLHQQDFKENNIKKFAGGLADIDFIVQYAVLAYSKEYPLLLQERSNIQILRQLQYFDLMTEHHVNLLICAQLCYQQLLLGEIILPEKQQACYDISAYQEAVLKIWDDIFNKNAI